jgi:5-oxoprolinase (ATP-hydrolysing) subunit A
VNLNADVGEGSAEEEEVLASVDSANVACGAHAGSRDVMAATAKRCQTLGIEIGAHPGYDDREHFGRVELGLAVDEIEDLIASQVGALVAIVPIAYVKAHGALYHRCQQDGAAADALVRVAKGHRAGVMGQPGFEIAAAAYRAGVPLYREGFADRRLLPDGSLAPRTAPDALLSAGAASEQALQLALSGRYDTICIHGDTAGAGKVAGAVREALRQGGITTGPLAR